VNITAADPGKRYAGGAHFQGGALIAGRLFKAQSKSQARGVVEIGTAMSLEYPDTDTVYVEKPTIRRQVRQPGDPNDVADLNLTNGAILMAFPQARHETVLVNVWKGSVPKEIMNRRVLERLTAEELSRLTTKNHNVLDAVGIGLWALGRL
jgi:hypothetical protein